MIGHQAVGMDADAEEAGALGQAREKGFPVAFGQEDVLPVLPSRRQHVHVLYT